MAVVWAARTDISPGTTGSWQDVDLDSFVASIPAGAGVAIIEIRSTTAEYNVGLRNNGSTDNRTNTIYADGSGNSRQWAICPFDTDHILEIFRGNTNVTFFVHGYIQSGVTGYTNALDRSITNTTAWTDLTALPGGATGGIYEIVLSTNDQWGLRMNGSTDSRLQFAYTHAWFAVGADGSQLVEGRISVTSVDFFEMGYFTADVTWNTNHPDRSIAATAAWTDLSALTTGATGGIIEVFMTTDSLWRGVRRNGDTTDPGTDAYPCGWRHGMGVCEADGSRLIEGYITNTSVDFFEVGVFTAAAAANDFSSVGTGELNGVGAAAATSVFDSQGTGELVMAGAALAESSFSSAGTGELNAVGAALADSVFDAQGAGDLAAIGESSASGAIDAQGTGDLSGVGAALAESVFDAQGTGDMTMVGATTAAGEAEFSMQGDSDMAMVGAAAASAEITVTGTSLATFVGEGGEAVVEEEPQTRPATDGGAGAWARPSSLRKKKKRELEREDEEIIAILRAIAPQLMQHRRVLH